MSEISRQTPGLAAQSIARLRAAVALYEHVCYANSLGAESIVLADLIWTNVPEIEIFTIDTGRLYPETYELIERIQQHYGRSLKVYYPRADALEAWASRHGINGFRAGIEPRQRCGATPKAPPCPRASAGTRAWGPGIRREQPASRARARPVEWDGNNGLYKISPLLDWSGADIWEYIRSKRLPYNSLHDRGFPSIGCAPCTRAVQAGEDERAGRWWWERPDSRECGLHPQRRFPAHGLPEIALAAGNE